MDSRKFNLLFASNPQQIKSISELRRMLMETSGLAVIGAIKTGKSTFLEKMWECDTKPDRNESTSKIQPYEIENVPNFMILDFPGR